MHSIKTSKTAGHGLRRVFLIALVAALLPLSALAYYPLRPGDEGDLVRNLQRALTANGFVTKVDGTYGPGTIAQVKAFQRACGLTVDGRAGHLTQTALYEGAVSAPKGESQDAPVAPAPAPAPVPGPAGPSVALSGRYQLGDSGLGVKQLQMALVARGYAVGKIDGVFGRQVALAVRQFQRATGLKVDGIAGRGTLGALSAATTTNPSLPLPLNPAPAPVPSQPAGLAVVKGGALNLRQTQSTQAKNIIAKVPSRAEVSVLSASGNWSYISYQGKTGYVMSRYLLSKPAAPLPTETPEAEEDKTLPAPLPETPVAGGLKRGDKGESVKAAQTRLKALGYAVNVDGSYGPGTAQAVVDFQRVHGMSASGNLSQDQLAVLYSQNAKSYTAPALNVPGSAHGGAPATGDVKLLHWYKDVRPKYRAGQVVTVYHPGSNLTFKLKLYSMGSHADSEPLTQTDTDIMNKGFGAASWDVRPVYVRFPDGVWSLATMHNMPHLNGSISNNGFPGHLCVHFLRDMDETEKNAPNYGVTNQKMIRKTWQGMTGQALAN